MTGAAGGVDTHIKDRAIDEAPVGIVITDPHRTDNPIVYANDTFEQITGYPAEEIVGRNCRFLQGPQTDQTAVDAMRTAIDDETAATVEVLNYRRDGETFWNEVTLAPVYDDAGELVNFVGFQSDVTDRKESELALAERTAELEHVLDRLNGLLYDITEALMHAGSRADTEVAICERLVAVDRYELAWVGEVDPVDGSVSPTTTAGAVGDLDDPIGGRGAEVLTETLETGSVLTNTTATESLAGGSTVSAVAVSPLIYRRQRYGVLVVGATDPTAFEGPEASVLEALGRTISTAIHAASTRQSVADASRVVATLDIADPAYPPAALAAAVDAHLEFEGAVQRRDGSAALFFTTSVDMETLTEVIENIESLSTPTEVTAIDGQRLIEVQEAAPSSVEWLAQLGATISDLTLADRRAILELALGPATDGRRVVDEIQDRFADTSLVAYRSEDRPPSTAGDYIARVEDRLTDRQHLALKRAFLGGFYESRREVTGDELAEAMDISRSTFHQHRRAAERKLIETFLAPAGLSDD